MHRCLSALSISIFAAVSLQAQDAPTITRYPTWPDSNRLMLVARARPDSQARHSSKAVRNGAIAGAVVGAVAGGYAASLIGFGCKLSLLPSGEQPPCHAARSAAGAVTFGAVLGALTLGLVGAGLGKMWQSLD